MINIINCKKIYNEGTEMEVVALKDVNFKVEKGESVAIMGVSGSGKSTLLHIIGCLDGMTEGEYYLDDKNISEYTSNELAEVRNAKIGFVMQENALINTDTVFENVKLPLCFSKKYKVKEFKELIMNTLASLGIDDLVKRKVKDLSGGQRQRVAIARAIVNDPDIILADEPTSALDSKTANEIMRIFREMQNHGKTVIVVTHDRAVADKMDRIVFIRDGIVHENTAPKESVAEIVNVKDKNNEIL